MLTLAELPLSWFASSLCLYSLSLSLSHTHILIFLLLSFSLSSSLFSNHRIGKLATRNALWILEGLYLAPSGTYKVQEMLQQGGWGCSHGGATGTFTPMWLMVARKPLKK